jgi:carboxypeptidase Q
MTIRVAGFLMVAFLGVPSGAQTVDRSVLAKIQTEATANSQVAPVFEMLTVNIGPRLTASPAHKRAAEWARDRLASYGLEGARLEPWKFGRGWTLEHLTVEMIEPRYLPLIGYADGWSRSTKGELVATPIFAGGKTPEEIEAMRDQFKNQIVLTQPIMTKFVRKDRPQPSDPEYVALSAGYATGIGETRSPGPTPAQRITKILGDAGAGVLLKPSIGEHGTVFVTGRDLGPSAAPSVTLAAEHYNMIVRMLEKKIPVKLRIALETKYYDSDGGNAYNVLAELPGSDPALRDEVVMLGGHLDSWHTGVGATDNADGATTMMEAVRVLKAINARPRRTIRIALWGGEEQGLLGSKAWVEQHLAGPANADARAKFDVYFNIDNGTGPIYGWFLQNNEAAKPIFESWIEPLKAHGVRRNVIEPVGATDHLSFVNAGVPGFNPIQDYVNYDVRTHHTNMDTPERVDVNEIRQAAATMAWFAYNAAMADQKIPRPPAK